jgi:hypothetical protein
VIGHPGGGEPIAVEDELAWTVTEGEFGATEAVVEEIILGLDAFSVGGKAEERGAFGASGDDRIVKEVKRADRRGGCGVRRSLRHRRDRGRGFRLRSNYFGR